MCRGSHHKLLNYATNSKLKYRYWATLLQRISITFIITVTLLIHPTILANEVEKQDNIIRRVNVFDDIFSVRFSKITFPQNSKTPAPALNLPLTSRNYPLSNSLARKLKRSNCPSVTTPDDPMIKYNIDNLIARIGGHPTHPSSNKHSDFWKQMREVVKLQQRRKRRGNSPASDVMPLPELWKGFSLKQVANAVHNEYPGFHQSQLIQKLLKDGATVDNSIIPKRSQNQFLNGIVMLAELNTWAVSAVGPYAFACKYYTGRCRPEEIAWAIKQGKMTAKHGVPQDIVRMVKSLNLSKQSSFTAYGEGCPSHPSWPAMHSAASSASSWLAVVLNLTNKQRCEAVLTDYAVAYGRTVAGVHYPDDNTAGLKLGMDIIMRELPNQLNERYGSTRQNVKNKIEEVKFDWDHFDPNVGCSSIL